MTRDVVYTMRLRESNVEVPDIGQKNGSLSCLLVHFNWSAMGRQAQNLAFQGLQLPASTLPDRLNSRHSRFLR